MPAGGLSPRTAICQSLSGFSSPFIAATKILFAISSQTGLVGQLQKLEHARSYTSPRTVSVSESKVELGRMNLKMLDMAGAPLNQMTELKQPPFSVNPKRDHLPESKGTSHHGKGPVPKKRAPTQGQTVLGLKVVGLGGNTTMEFTTQYGIVAMTAMRQSPYASLFTLIMSNMPVVGFTDRSHERGRYPP